MLRSRVTAPALRRFDRFAEPSGNDCYLIIVVAHRVGREGPATAAQVRRWGLTSAVD